LTSPRYAALTQPTSLSLPEIQQLLDPDTLLLEYALGDERSYVWAVTRAGLMGAQLPSRTEIEAAARRLYEQVTGPERGRGSAPEAANDGWNAEYAQQAAALSDMVLGPVASQLGAKRLLLVADGALQYVPFGALPLPRGQTATGCGPSAPDRAGSPAFGCVVRPPDLCSTLRGGCPLVVTHELVSLPSASALAVLRLEFAGRQPRPKELAVVADPVFDGEDVRVRRGPGRSVSVSAAPAAGELDRALDAVGLPAFGNRIPRLPFSRQEAERILALLPPGSGFKALDFDASRATATTALAEYRMVHFATHALVNSEHPELSGLVLSLVDGRGTPQDGFLRLHDVYNLSLPADLVVLSACRTALGEDVRGEGFVGLTRGFFYAGAARLVASLWKVDDAATAELMTRFYAAMLKDGLAPAAALRRAQVELWSSRRWHAPYYWAAFFLQGEWRDARPASPARTVSR
jgi:CHAT domain-containing protein